MDKQQKDLKERVKKVRNGPFGFCYVPENWPKKLWDMPAVEISDYILSRFDETTDEIEYYTCLVYLYSNTTKFNKLLLEWKDSTNYQRFLKSLKEEDKIMNANKPGKAEKIDKKPKTTDKTKATRKTKVKPKKVSRTVPITKNFV